MISTDALHQQVILDHGRGLHGFRDHAAFWQATAEAGLLGVSDVTGARVCGPVSARGGAADSVVAHSTQVNTICGDEVSVLVRRDARDQLTVTWTGEGCTISKAAMSALHDAVTGRTADQAVAVLDHYRTVLRSAGRLAADERLLGDAVAFAGTGRLARRVKCAMLGCVALQDALYRTDQFHEPATSHGVPVLSDEEMR